MRQVFNFSAGPSVLSEDVLKEVQRDLMNYGGSGISVMEMSHRTPLYEAINSEAESLMRELLSIPDNYDIIFVQGGASTQFEAVPLNLLSSGKADYLVTGVFAKKAFAEAQKFGDIKCTLSTADKDFTYIPEIDPSIFRSDADYVHHCTNNTIYGTRFVNVPDTAGIPLVADMSSCILSEKIDVSKYGVIYAGAQKNVGPAGMTIVIVRKDLQSRALPTCPTMLKWSTQIGEKSLYNTPPTFSTYVAMLTMRWIKNLGGVQTIQKINEHKAALLYDFVDNSGFYINNVEKSCRSIMNIPFKTADKDLDAKFIKEAAANGLIQLKGHRLVGGMRASIYNAMPLEGVQKLISFMQKFELENK